VAREDVPSSETARENYGCVRHGEGEAWGGGRQWVCGEKGCPSCRMAGWQRTDGRLRPPRSPYQHGGRVYRHGVSLGHSHS
jgi:hypothetical protein